MKTRTKTASIIYMLFVVSYIAGRVWSVPHIIANLLVAGVGLCAWVYCFFKRGLCSKNKTLIAFGLLFTVMMIASIFYNGNADILDVFWIWAYAGIAALIYEFEVPQKICWLGVGFFAVLICFHIISGGAPRDFLSMGSENNISACLIFFILVAYLAQSPKKKLLNHIPTLFCLFVCLWTGSRGGSLAAIVLMVCVAAHNVLSLKKGRTIALLKIFVAFVLVLAGVAIFFSEYMTAFVEKMDQYGGKSVRTEIWAEYINASFESVGNFLLGVNTTDPTLEMLSFYSGNPHNSFLILHANLGIIACFLIFALYIKVISKARKEKNAVIIIVLIAASARMFFDWIAFTGVFDVLFWYMLLYATDTKEKDGCSTIDLQEKYK